MLRPEPAGGRKAAAHQTTGAFRLSTLALALAMSGCSLFKTEAPENARQLIGDVPQQWNGGTAGNTDTTGTTATGTSAQLVGDGWLDDFADPQLSSIVEAVWAQNNGLLTALARRDQAAAKAQLDRSQLYPRIDGQAQVGRQRQINDFLGDVPLAPEDAYISRIRVGLGVSWELDLWGRAFNAKEASVGDLWATDLDVQSAKFSLAAQATNLWFNLIAAQKRMELSADLVKSFEDALSVAQHRFDSGLVTSAELRQIRSDYVAAQAQALTHRLDRGRAARQLEVLMGRYPANAIVAGDTLPALPAPLSAGVPAELLERRPDVQSAAIRVLASDQRLLSAKKNLLPHFTIQAQGAFQSAYRDTLFDGDSFVWSIGGGIFQPLFDGGQIRAGIKAQRAALFESIYRYRDKVYSAFREVEDGLEADSELREQRKLLDQSLLLAQENEESAKASYDRGNLDMRVWLTAQRGTVQAELSRLDLDLLLLNNRVALALALGGRPRAASDAPAVAEGTDAPASTAIEVSSPSATPQPTPQAVLIQPEPAGKPAVDSTPTRDPLPLAAAVVPSSGLVADTTPVATRESASEPASPVVDPAAVEPTAPLAPPAPSIAAVPEPAEPAPSPPAVTPSVTADTAIPEAPLVATVEVTPAEADIAPPPLTPVAQAAPEPATTPVAAATTEAAPQPVQVQMPTQPAPRPPAASVTKAKTQQSLNATTPAPAPAVGSAAAAAAAISRPTQPAVTKLADMPAAYRGDFPRIRFDVHVYDEDPERRFVQMGEKRFHEGDTLSEGPRIVAITSEGVVFDYRGQRSLYTLNR